MIRKLLVLTAVCWNPLADCPAVLGQDAIRFAHRAAEVGDVMRQSVEFRLQLAMQYLQADQQAAGESTELLRRQSRIVEVRQIEASKVTAARVAFMNASQELRENSAEPHAEASPVSGKTYDVVREGDKLRITDTDGAIPPLAEYELVATAMASVGRVNPLARFLAGRTVQIGERIALPKELARLFFESAEDVGDVQRFELTLRGRREVAGRDCGVFELGLEARTRGGPQMAMQIGGQAVVDTASCRMMELRVSGPVALTETRGPAGGQYRVSGQGTLQVAMAANYDDVE